MNSPDPDTGPECRTCKHAYITYESSFPHGCRLFGFKSASPPSQVVFESTGQPCQGYEPRANLNKDGDARGWKA